MDLAAKIYVAGHSGLVGSAIVRTLHIRGYSNVITRTLQELDLRNQHAVNEFFAHEKPEYVFLAAARVGGIKANASLPALFIYDNIMIEANVIHAAYIYGTKKLLFLGSSCIYPKHCQQPIKEEYLLTGDLEPTNKPYALAKMTGIALCQAYNQQYGTNFISCMPTNLYGPGDTFDEEYSHVIPGLITKIHRAKIHNDTHVVAWGSGNALREFLYSDDLADALIFLMHHYDSSEPINIGSGSDIAIKELAAYIKHIIDYSGTIQFDHKHPDGTPRKLLDCSRMQSLGWAPKTALLDGLEKTYAWYCVQYGMGITRGNEYTVQKNC